MRILQIAAIGVALAGLIGSGPANSQEFSQSSGGGLFSIFDEVRAGGSFSIQPDYDPGFVIRGELIFKSFVPPFDNYFANTLLRPRVHLGGNFGTGDGGINQAFAGFTWNFPLPYNLFVEATFGMTVHDGPLESATGIDLGCNVLFRESIGLGADIGEHWRVLAAVDHSSHAHLICDGGNSGITHAGVYVGYRF
jgi:hypothetical protein